MSAKTKPLAVPPAEAVEMGTGNVFANLGLPDAGERQLRVQLATRLNDLIQAERLTQAAAAQRLGLAQPHVSELKNYKLGRFSSERLLHLITLMDRDVEIFIRPPRRAGHPRSNRRRRHSVGSRVATHRRALAAQGTLFASLQQRAFAGAL